jgi:hypothetical protein
VRKSRQFMGRGGRQGWWGQHQLIVDQKEYDYLLPADKICRDARDIELFQKLSETKRKSERRFANRLGAVKNYFFQHYIVFTQDESHNTPDVMSKWANCLSNMDIEWNRIKSQLTPQKLPEAILLEKCTRGLIWRACKDWNFLVPNDERFMLSRLTVFTHITQDKRIQMESPPLEDRYNLGMTLHDVSAAMHYLDHSPLYMTVPGKADTVKKLLENKTLAITYECIGQIFEREMHVGNFHKLPEAFLELITRAYGEPGVFRKKLVEIFALGRRSGSETLQALLQKVFLEKLHSFALKKLSGLGSIAMDRSVLNDKTLTPEGEAIVALLYSLHAAKARLQWESEQELSNMSPLQATATTVVTAVTNYFYESLPQVIDKLIELIDHPFTREKAILDEVLEEGETSVLYMDSWCVLFKQNKTYDRPVREEELKNGYSFCELRSGGG